MPKTTAERSAAWYQRHRQETLKCRVCGRTIRRGGFGAKILLHKKCDERQYRRMLRVYRSLLPKDSPGSLGSSDALSG